MSENYYQKQNSCNRKLVYFAKNSNLLPQPADTKSIGFPFVELQSVDSTNNYARKQIHAGLARHGMVFFAHEQYSGKGQRGKGWCSEKDANLILSIVVIPETLLLTRQFMLSACVAMAIHDFLKQYAGSDIKIKWPNDLYWQDRKAGGVLIESGVRSRQLEISSQQPVASNWEWAIVGIGININQTAFPSDLPNPVSLKQITGKDFNVVELAKELCVHIEKHFRRLLAEGYYGIYDQYVANLYKKDAVVKLKKGTRVFDAAIKSVSLSGKLIVHPDSNRDIEEEFDFGEVEWVI